MSLLTDAVRLQLNNLGGFPPASEFLLGDTLNSLAEGAGNPALDGPGLPVSLFVGPTGNDTTGTGSAAAPYLTIERALLDVPVYVQRRITIRLAAGTYGVAGVTTVMLLQRFLIDFYNAQVVIEGDPGSLDETVTVVAVAPHPTDPAQTRLNIGAFTFAITPNETFVVRTDPFSGGDTWYAVTAAASPNIDIVASNAGFLPAPGETLRVRNLSVSIDELDMRGPTSAYPSSADMRLSLRGVRLTGFSTIINTGLQGANAIGQIANISGSMFGGLFWGNSGGISEGSGEGSIRGIKFTADAVIQWAAGTVFVTDTIHQQPLGSALLSKFIAVGGTLNLSGGMTFGGLGICVNADDGGKVDAQCVFLLAAVSRLGLVRRNSVWNRSFGSASGSCTSQAMQISEASTALGLEAGYAAVTSVPAGNDVLVGANAAITWVALPADDLGAAAGVRQICRAT